MSRGRSKLFNIPGQGEGKAHDAIRVALGFVGVEVEPHW